MNKPDEKPTSVVKNLIINIGLLTNFFKKNKIKSVPLIVMGYINIFKRRPIITILATLFAYGIYLQATETDEDRTQKAGKYMADKYTDNINRQNDEKQNKLKKEYGFEGIKIPGEK